MIGVSTHSVSVGGDGGGAGCSQLVQPVPVSMFGDGGCGLPIGEMTGGTSLFGIGAGVIGLATGTGTGAGAVCSQTVQLETGFVLVDGGGTTNTGSLIGAVSLVGTSPRVGLSNSVLGVVGPSKFGLVGG